MKRVIETDEAPAAVGAYSQATTNGSLLYTAGQIPLTPDGELLDDEDIATQTTQSLDNVMAILAEAGADATDVLKTTVFLADIDDFDEMNETYATYFDEEPPARSAVEVGNLPKGVGVEIEAVAVVDEE
ncbi:MULTISPECIES: Rid family detoxifying hydrolase [Haloferax]|uniref:Endoribonuclease L-PSP n=7 Tax=Haloferax TaxID=2251 RepID=A0A384KXM9_HALVD|nr:MULTISPECIES: Rid family detoxifying hydrolase [Haloferax]ADE04640.1 enamine/imine deaminase [Haloferax volcanii DS2]ELK54532.1 endoribonuclease L-PSP [Haloferax sp. BAB-2207]ELY25944.1 endoribonuclease L-PSP [Haloferax volcanii DS2]ELZ70681.1 endoribonuclease L-PSP [Haloferax lucentense DSM 14919]ELZ90888.1 endoribonuclease L-PSP [Haloferax alexandrinus JCM 10717]